MADAVSMQAANVLARLTGAPARVLLRVAIDAVEGLASAGLPAHLPRSAGSGVCIGNVRVADNGRARIVDAKDGTGGAWLVWEILAQRPLEGDPPRLHELVDDLPADVDDLVARAMAEDDAFADVEELFEALTRASDGSAAEHEEVAEALGLSPAPPKALTGGVVRASGATVLLIADGAALDPLARALAEAGHTLLRRGDAGTGFQAARAHGPAVVVIDNDVRGGGDVVAIKIRREPGAIGNTPILLLADPTDTRGRVARFAIGADVCLLKPLKLADVVAQVGALVRIAGRLREAHAAVAHIVRPSAANISGELDDVPPRALLTLLEMERRSGVVTLEHGGVRATLDVEFGKLAKATLWDGPSDVPRVLGVVLEWTTGAFSFRETAPTATTASAVAISAAIAAWRAD